MNADKDYIMDVEIDDVSCETDDYFCITLYRVVQECLLNIKNIHRLPGYYFIVKKRSRNMKF